MKTILRALHDRAEGKRQKAHDNTVAAQERLQTFTEREQAVVDAAQARERDFTEKAQRLGQKADDYENPSVTGQQHLRGKAAVASISVATVLLASVAWNKLDDIDFPDVSGGFKNAADTVLNLFPSSDPAQYRDGGDWRIRLGAWGDNLEGAKREVKQLKNKVGAMVCVTPAGEHFTVSADTFADKATANAAAPFWKSVKTDAYADDLQCNGL